MRTWLDLEERFRRLADALRHVRLDVQWGAAGEYWRLAGVPGSSETIRQFEALCGIGGKFLAYALDKDSALGSTLLAESDPKRRWYRLLKDHSGAFHHELSGTQHDENGTYRGHIFSGSISGVAEVSANVCLELHASYPVRDDRAWYRRLYDDYGKEIVIGTILAILTAIIGVTFG